jgi:arsenate reductase
MVSKEKTVLFICVGNSARSQIAEELLRKYGGTKFRVESAGLNPSEINPFVIRILKEDENIDISGKKTKSVMDLLKKEKHYQYVITVCSRAEEEGCPIFPGVINRFSWPFEDPAKFTGSEEELLQQVRFVKNTIKQKIMDFITAGESTE